LEPAAILRSLEDGDLDLALRMNVEHTRSIRSTSMLADRFVALRGTRAFNPDEIPDGAEFPKLPRLRIAQGRYDTGFSDRIIAVFADRGQKAVDATEWLAAGPILEATDLVLITSRRFGRITCRKYDVTPIEIPTETPSIEWRFYWHGKNDLDGGSISLRSADKTITAAHDHSPSEW
jgi:DNA-binding transcriptional LysR family regulator